MKAVKVHENSSISVFFRPGATDFTLVSFGHMGFRETEHSAYWAQRLTDRHDMECIGITPRTDRWFPQSAMIDAFPAIAACSRKPVITYGHSMGAYGALKYSGLLGSIGTLASSPMFSIDPADVPNDGRYIDNFDPVLHEGMRLSPRDVSGRLVIVYDPYVEIEKYHADEIEKLGNTFPIKATFFAHEAVQILLARPILFALFGFLRTGLLTPDFRQQVRRMCRQNAKYWTAVADHMICHDGSGRYHRRAAALLDRVERFPEAEVPMRVSQLREIMAAQAAMLAQG